MFAIKKPNPYPIKDRSEGEKEELLEQAAFFASLSKDFLEQQFMAY